MMKIEKGIGDVINAVNNARKDLESAIFGAGLSAPIAVIIGGLFARDYYNHHAPGHFKSEIYHQAAIVADVNKDHRTTTDEWAEVYKTLGVRFDELNPTRLSDEQLQQYIDIKIEEYQDRRERD
ncbi:hypothetical protein ACFL96_03280 [Thermoproteota archaeon]